MNIVVIDGQGGSIGCALIEGLRKRGVQASVTAIGTNAIAAGAMLKAGADRAATGENPVVVACRTADIVAGPMGILQADAMLGEITPKMALAVSGCAAQKVLVPVNRCRVYVASTREMSLSEYVALAVERIAALCERCD